MSHFSDELLLLYFNGMRIRADFFSRPPRIGGDALKAIWQRAECETPPVVCLSELAEQKKTMREKDYPIIGALAERMQAPLERLRYSRDASAILLMMESSPQVFAQALASRAVLQHAKDGREALETALDSERREFMRADERRLKQYAQTAAPWQLEWPKLGPQVAGLSLLESHKQIVERAISLLPCSVGSAFDRGE